MPQLSFPAPRALAALVLCGAAVPGSLPVAAAADAAPRYTLFSGNDQCPTNNSVSRIVGPPGSLSGTVGVGNCPAGIAFTPDRRTAFVLNAADSTVTPIDAASFTAGVAFPAGVVAPIFAAVTPDGASLVTGGAGSNQLAVISTARTSDVKTVNVGITPLGVAVLPDSSAVYVGNGGDGTVSIVTLGPDPTLAKTITFPAPGCLPYGMAVTPDGSAVYAACSNGPLWKISTRTRTAAATPIALPAGSATTEVVITHDGRTAYVSDANGAVYPVTLKTGTVGTPIPIPGAYGLAISPDGAVLAVGNGTCCFVDTPLTFVSIPGNAVVGRFDTPGLYAHRWIAYR